MVVSAAFAVVKRPGNTYPTPIAEMNVPKNAKTRIEPKLRKKFSCFSSYPELRMIGGRRRLKNSVCLNVW